MRERSARIALLSPPPQRIEGPQLHPLPPAVPPRLSFWQVTLRAIPILVAVASTAVLGYFLISQRWFPQAQVQQPQQVAQTSPQPQAPAQPSPVQAQQPPAQQQDQVQEPEPPVPNPLPPIPSDDRLVILINSVLIALNQANATGNYSVLRDMAAPSFKRVNSPERLAQVFTNLRSRNLDLSPIILFQPKLYQKPEMNAQGMVRITGFFPTSPDRVNFNLVFQPVQGRWRLFGLAVNTSPEPAAQPSAAPADAAKPAAPAAKPASQAAKPTAAAKRAATETGSSADNPSEDIRDRIDNPPPPPPAPAKPKTKSLFNPFGN